MDCEKYASILNESEKYVVRLFSSSKTSDVNILIIDFDIPQNL